MSEDISWFEHSDGSELFLLVPEMDQRVYTDFSLKKNMESDWKLGLLIEDVFVGVDGN